MLHRLTITLILASVCSTAAAEPKITVLPDGRVICSPSRNEACLQVKWQEDRRQEDRIFQREREKSDERIRQHREHVEKIYEQRR